VTSCPAACAAMRPVPPHPRSDPKAALAGCSHRGRVDSKSPVTLEPLQGRIRPARRSAARPRPSGPRTPDGRVCSPVLGPVTQRAQQAWRKQSSLSALRSIRVCYAVDEDSRSAKCSTRVPGGAGIAARNAVTIEAIQSDRSRADVRGSRQDRSCDGWYSGWGGLKVSEDSPAEAPEHVDTACSRRVPSESP